MNSNSRPCGALLCAFALLWAIPVLAQDRQDRDQAVGQEEMMQAWQQAGQPGKAHKQLAKLVGSWNAEIRFWMDPAAEPMVSKGTMDYELLMGGRYLQERVRSDFMGQPFTGLGIYGYDNVTGEIQAIWIDDMSTAVHVYRGSINEAGDEIVLMNRHMDPATKEWRETRSLMHLLPGDRLHYVSYDVTGGQETKMMEIDATRIGQAMRSDR